MMTMMVMMVMMVMMMSLDMLLCKLKAEQC